MKLITLLAALAILTSTCFAGRTAKERAAYNQRRESFLKDEAIQNEVTALIRRAKKRTPIYQQGNNDTLAKPEDEEALDTLSSKDERLLKAHVSFLTWWKKSAHKFFWWSVLTPEEQHIITLENPSAPDTYKHTAYVDKDYEDVYVMLTEWNKLSDKKQEQKWRKISDWERSIITENAHYYKAINQDINNRFERMSS